MFGAAERRSIGAYVLVFVFICSLSQSQSGSTLAVVFALGSDCTENRGLLIAQALLELTAKLVQQARCMAFCEYALAHSMLACWRNWIPGKKACLFCQTALVFQSLFAYCFCGLQCIKVKPCSQRSKYSHSQRKALSSKPAATVTLVHAYDGITGIVSRTAGQIVSLLPAE